MPRSMHLHTEIYPNLKSISELFKMYIKSLLAAGNKTVYLQMEIFTNNTSLRFIVRHFMHTILQNKLNNTCWMKQ